MSESEPILVNVPKKIKIDNQTTKRLDKIEVAMVMLLDELKAHGQLQGGMANLLTKMITNRQE